MTSDDIKQAVRDVIAEEILTEEAAKKFWLAGLQVLQEQAQNHAGRYVLGGLGALLQKLAIFTLVGGFVYAIGGWSALAGLFKTLFTSGSA